MKKVFERTLIICPHCDDELFTFGLIYSNENYFKEIDLLLIGHNPDRIKESIISSKINKLNLINLPNYFKFHDSFYHINFESLKNYFGLGRIYKTFTKKLKVIVRILFLLYF